MNKQRAEGDSRHRQTRHWHESTAAQRASQTVGPQGRPPTPALRTLTPMGLPMPRRYSTCALSSCRVRSPHHRKWPLQPYHRPVVESSRVSASS